MKKDIIYPWDVAKFTINTYTDCESLPQQIENIWKNLKDFKPKINYIPLIDSSFYGNNAIMCSNYNIIDVNYGVGIYCTEHMNTTFFRDTIIKNISEQYTNFINISLNSNLSKKNFQEKIDVCLENSDKLNTYFDLTNIFDTILNMYRNSKVNDNINLLYISNISPEYFTSINDSRMPDIKEEFEKAGVRFPKFIYWNIFKQISGKPKIIYHNNYIEIEGFSPKAFDIVIKGKF